MWVEPVNRARTAATAAQKELDRPSLDRLHDLLDASESGDMSASYALGFREGLSWGVSQLSRLADATDAVDEHNDLVVTIAHCLGAWRHTPDDDVSVLSTTEATAMLSAIEMTGWRIVKRKAGNHD